MPKIIKNLNEKIIKVCVKLFGKHGYENVEMKMIAKECEVAVGTLYNYYSSKWDIYSEVLSQFWNNISIDINKIAKKEISNEDKFSELVYYLEGELKSNVALCEVFFNHNMNDVDYIAVDEMNKNIIIEISDIIKPLFKNKELSSYKNSLKEISQVLLILTSSYRNESKQSAEIIISLFKSAL